MEKLLAQNATPGGSHASIEIHRTQIVTILTKVDTEWPTNEIPHVSQSPPDRQHRIL